MTERMPSGGPDAALVVGASRARTQAVIVAGLLHDLNGPLNTLRLTLDLLERVLASRAPGSAEADARVRRYLATLRDEGARMTAWGRAASAAVGGGGETPAHGLRALLDEALRLLRHHAALSEVRLEPVARIDGTDDADVAADMEVGDVPADMEVADGAADIEVADVAADIEVADVAADIEVADVAATRALLTTLVYDAIALASAGAVVRASIAARAPRVRVAIAPAALPADAAHAFAHPREAPASALAVDLLSLRTQAEALRGQAYLHADAQGVTLEIALPRA